MAPRFRRCSCVAKSKADFSRSRSPVSELFPNRTTPQLQRLQTELGARRSLREAARLMKMFLPCHRPHNTTIRNWLAQVAQGLERCTFNPKVNDSSAALTVFLDDAHIRCRPEHQQRHLNVVVGKIEDRNICRRFGLVANATAAPKTQIKNALSAAGWTPGRPETVISDGEHALPNLISDAVGGPVVYILDWFHISMRIRHVEMAVKGLVQTKGFCGIPTLFQRPAERLRWWLWHGRFRMAATDLRWLIKDCVRLCSQEHTLHGAAVKSTSPLSRPVFLRREQHECLDRLRCAVPPRAGDLHITRRRMRQRHRQCPHGKTPAHEVVSQGRPSCGHHKS